jgi:hypothetical protein
MRQNWRSKRVTQTKQNKACLSGSLKNYESILKRGEKRSFLERTFFFRVSYYFEVSHISVEGVPFIVSLSSAPNIVRDM